ncbi:hypothetical protein KIW84_031287 [Lathyrus oleraceus]|uniref:DAGKc domain-containing protein n=1 Tax=Pisum sativum TaxID=3888 RepID=A0A9D4XQT9_PEA|nr:hypothetical protein KIW84_031287 [Pisum sativum]
MHDSKDVPGDVSSKKLRVEVVKTTFVGHARNVASTVDISTCPDGIICVGGDGIINEVFNGLLSRDNQKEGISIPIGIIPAGSNNSLVWTVLGVRDPISAAMAIVKGALPLQMSLLYEVEYLPASKAEREGKLSGEKEVVDISELAYCARPGCS